MQGHKLRRAMLGYSKNSVIDYAAALSEDFNIKLVEKTREAEDLQKKADGLENEQTRLLAHIKELETELAEKNKPSREKIMFETLSLQLTEKKDKLESYERDMVRLEEENHRLTEKVDRLERENEDLHGAISAEDLLERKMELGKMMIEAKKNAAVLRKSAEEDYEMATERNRILLETQKEELNHFMEKLNEFRSEIMSFLLNFTEELGEKEQDMVDLSDNIKIG